MKITFITNSPVWSLGKFQGAPSFYNTIALYADKGYDITFLTTEKQLDLNEFESVSIIEMPKLPCIESHFAFGFLRLINKHVNFFLSQFIALYYLYITSRQSNAVYAYEIGYIPGSKWFCTLFSKKLITRFQGTVLTDLVNPISVRKKLLKCIQFLDQIWALRVKSDLLLMTNDGTKGKSVVKSITLRTRNISFLRNGVDLPNESDLQQLLPKKNQSAVMFASASRLQPWKRIDRSLRIFAKVSEKWPDCHYTICGDGIVLNDARELTEKLNISHKVTFLGAVTKTDIYEVLLQSHFFLSTYELSNLGNPLFEAISCNSLVVTVDNGDTAELISDMETGIITSENDYLSNADKILSLIEQPDLQTQILANAKQRLSDDFCSWPIRMEHEYSITQPIIDA